MESAGVSFGSFDAAVIRSLSFQTGNGLAERKDVNSDDGVKGMYIGSRDPQLSVVVEAELEATKAWAGNFTNRTEEAVDSLVGSVAGNKVTLTMPKFVIDEPPTPANENGIVLFTLSGQTRESSGNDNITIKFS